MSKIEGNAHFLSDFRRWVHADIFNLFNLGRHLGSAAIYRYLRLRSFASWENVTSRPVSVYPGTLPPYSTLAPIILFVHEGQINRPAQPIMT